jgi:hypothetical protein
MALVNQDKPSANTPTTYLNIGSGFRLIVGGIYNLIINPAGTGIFTNTDKVNFAELWSTITTTYASEVRTWDATGSLFSNTAKPTTTFSNISKPV